jgi:hypothetical protein
MCYAQSYFHKKDSFRHYSKQILYFYSPLQILDTEDKFFPLSSIRNVSNLLIIFPTLLRMPMHQFRIPRVREHMFQTIDHSNVPHHQGMNFPLRHVLFIRIKFIINTLRTVAVLFLFFYLFSL